MARNLNNAGLAEVLRRSCALAPQPSEYHSTLSPMLFPPELTKAFDDERSADRSSKSLPRPVGSLIKQVTTRDEMIGAAKSISKLVSRAISFKAPPGTGKSTVLPWEVYERSSNPVVVLVPTTVIAQALVSEMLEYGWQASYVSPTRFSVSPVSRDMGVVYTTVDGMVMRAFAAQKDMTDIDTSMTVFHDDCHLANGSNEFLTSMWPDYPAIVKMVSVSAEAVPSVQKHDAQLSASPAGANLPVVVSVPFKEESEVTLADVLPDGSPAPWSVEGLRNKRTLMFVESDRIAEYMRGAYNNFLETYTLRRHNSYDHYKQVRAVLADPKPEGLLIITDSTFQVGMKFVLEQIIDFGNIRRTVAGSGLQPVDEYMKVTVSERAARVHKSSGLVEDVVVAFVPEIPPANVDASLSTAERDKVAALCTLFQYEVPVKYEPEFGGDKLSQAHLPTFLAGELPWEVWTNIRYRNRVEEPAVDNVPPDIGSLLDWVGGARVEITPVELLSGQAYQSSTGLATVRADVANIIMDDYGDLYTWLREKIHSTGVRKFCDMSDTEAETVWLVWLTAWNWNVADLVALDRWRASHGKAVDNWRSRADCRSNVARLLGVARDIHDRWLLLSTWYRDMFATYPYQLVGVSPNDTLVEERLADMLRALGVGLVAPHMMGIAAGVADARSTRRGGVIGTVRRAVVSNEQSGALCLIRRGRALE